MPPQQTPALRIYCLCGQKMRVSETMYGRRARCVACQLKIRLPRLEEVPKSTTVLYLRDHPEFIREHQPGKAESRIPDQREKRRRAKISVPLEPLEPLQKLCSLRKKIKEELRKDNGRSSAELEAFRMRLEEVVAALDDELHQRLMEAAIELTAAQEKLAELTVSARVGEVDYGTYRAQVNRLRWRRECLEKRQVNLRAWLAVRDADLAGGYIDLPLAHMDQISLRVPLSEEGEEPPVLLGWMVEQLRAAFADRKRAEQNLETINHLREQKEVSEKEGKRSAKEQKALRARATAAVRFWQERLERFKRDIEADRRVVEAQLELARGRRQLGELGREELDGVQRELRRAKADLEKARHTIERAVSAPSGRDLPALRGTFLKRLGAPTAPRHRSGMVFAILGLLFMVAIVLAVILGIVWGVIPMPPFSGGQLAGPVTPPVVEQAESPEPVETATEAEEPLPQEESVPSEEAASAEPEHVPAEELETQPVPLEEESTSEAASVEETAEAELPEETAVVSSEEPVAVSPDEVTGEVPATLEAPVVSENTIEVELRGVVAVTDKAPRFSLRIYTPDGKARERVRELGDGVAEGWVIREYNPEQQSITLFNGEDIVIIRRGEREPIPVAPPDEP